MTLIRLGARHWQAIEGAAGSAYPAECCGLLVGTGGEGSIPITITQVIAAPNIADGDGRDRFEVDPQIRFDVEREVRTGPERVIGHYHSHPDHPAEPSKTDLAKAFEPSLIWLIISVGKDGAGEMRGFRLAAGGDGFDELDLELDQPA
ncbi:MAG: M67 family metallopeptidase [Rhodospirillales bacterium]|nr:M67 family metallopeptidase [Rhodospirillales bacterium]